MATEIYPPPQLLKGSKIYVPPTDDTGSASYEDPTEVVFEGALSFASVKPTVA